MPFLTIRAGCRSTRVSAGILPGARRLKTLCGKASCGSGCIPKDRWWGCIVTQDDRLVYVNPVFAQIFGYTPQELMAGMSPLDLVHPDDRDFGQPKNSRASGRQSIRSSIHFKGVKKDGSIVHCEILGRLVEYQGRTAILGSLLDITQRLQSRRGSAGE